MGAIAEGGVQVLNEGLIRQLGVPTALVHQTAARERLELERRDQMYRNGRPLAPVRDRNVILVDDGLATGSTMQAALLALKPLAPARIVVAAPVGARETCDRLARIADEVVCVEKPEVFEAVGQWYRDFDQTTDDEVQRLLTGSTSGDAVGTAGETLVASEAMSH
jgi:predicted phosphoribosyltransferase